MNHADKISESVEELDRLSEQQKLTLRRDRIQFLINLKNGCTQAQAGDRHRSTPEPEVVAHLPQRRTGRLVGTKPQDPLWQTQLGPDQPPAFVFAN